MTNRFIPLLWSLPTVVGSILLFCLPIGLYAQVDKFNFNYSGPNVVPAGPNCNLTLASAIMPLPTVTSTIGATITMSMQDPSETTDNYAFNDPIPAPYTLSVGWFVKDNLGNSAVFYFPITILDLTPPVFDLTNHPSTLNLGSVVQVPPAVNPPVTDNCTNSNQIVVTFTQTTPPDTCLAGTFIRTWKATDLVGNTTTFTQTINITADMLPPLVGSPPQNGSSPCAQLATAYPLWLATQLNTNFMVSDVSGIKSITSNGPATFPPGCAVPLTVTFKATDNCNLFTTRTATFTTSDTQAPIVAVEAKDTVGYCSLTNGHLLALNKWINKHGYQQSSDACTPSSMLVYSMKIGGVVRDSAQVVAALLASFANGCGSQMIGNQTFAQVRAKITVDFLVRDACGLESNAGQATFGVIDTLSPVITGTNKTEECGGGNDQTALTTWINAHGNATVTDECSATTWTNFSFVTSTGQSGTGAFNSGPYPTVVANNCSWYVDVTFHATDDCGNIGSKTLRFRITDLTVPVITGFSPVTVYCPNTVPANPMVTATDNCDASVTLVHGAPVTTLLACSGKYDVRFTWTATDDCGNTATAIQIFQVRDTTGPVFTLVPGPKTFRCDTFVLPPPVVKDVNIDADDECSVVQQNITTQTISNQNPNPAVCGHYSYQITRIFTASDDCGNTRTATQVLTIVDNLGPVPTGTLDTTVVCEVTPVVSPPKALDACAGITAPPVFLNQVTTPGSCDNNYLVTLNWRAQDVCGNTTLFTQTIHVQDTMRPTLTGIPANITVSCEAIPAPPAISSFTGADNCDQMVSISLAETETRDPDPTHCAHWTNYQIHRTWTATDNCGNTRAYTQTLQVEDHTGPILTLPATMQLPNDAGDCGAEIMIPAPVSVYDLCTSLPDNIILLDTALLIYSGSGPIGTSPVDTVVLQWTAPNTPPNSPATGNALLTVYLDNVDAETNSERFTILGEDNQPIGLTELTNIQCGFSITVNTILASKLNTWLADGQLTLRLAPNGTGGGAANAICPGGRVRATLSYPAATPQVPVTLTYKLDNNPPASYPPASPQFISTGTHTILYTATDCAGNSTTATLILNVQDTEPPVITAPAPITAYVGQNNCLATVILPFPLISENCAVSGTLSRVSAVLNVGFFTSANAGIVPKNTTLNVGGLIPNAVGMGRLTIRHKGDNAQNGEFFNIFDKPGASLGITTLGPDADQCNLFHESVFNVTANQINSWAGVNGITFFVAVSNKSVPAYNDFISPCMLPLLANTTDGISQIQAILQYNYAHINYEITKGGVPVQSDTLKGNNQTTVTLPPGIYTVKYRVSDLSGVEGMTTFLLTVRDTVKPKAFCVSKIIQTNPSGVQNYTLLPSEINNNSVDNCSGTNLTFALSQTIFNCNQAPNSFPVTLTVTDTSGNSSTCTALVKVETIILHPKYGPVCENGTLNLYADSLLAPGNTIYTFMWTGPNGFVSNLQNPSIPSATTQYEGSYTVKITGLTGCTATGTVIITLLKLPTQPILLVTPGPYCQGSNVVLSTPSYSGQNVNYFWYKGNQASSVLLDSTLASNYPIVLDSTGQRLYFVKVSGNGCTSVNSDILSIQVYAKPIATVEVPAIIVCSGQTIMLGTPVSGNGLTYSWTGPSQYASSAQYPAIQNASISNAGSYRLVITSNGCVSEPAFVLVTVKARPAQPQIVSSGAKVCEGATVTLLAANYGSNINYIWKAQSPPWDTIIHNINTLTLQNVMTSDSGYWRLIVEAGGCLSDTSAPFLVQVQAYPDVTAEANSPLCNGQPLQLMATGNADTLSWTWMGPNGFVRYIKNPKLSPGVPGQYKVVGKTSFGCADSAFVNVVVSPAPVIDTITNNAPVCASCNSTATLQAVIQPIYGPLTYMWTGPGGFVSIAASPLIPGVCTADNGTYILIVKDTFGCPSLPKSTVVQVQPIPNTPLISLMKDSVCQGEMVTFTVSNANQYTGNVQYNWKEPISAGGGVTSTTTPSFTVGPVSGVNAGDYIVWVTVNNCVSPFSAPAQLTVIQTPSAPNATSPNPTLCEGETLELLAIPSSTGTYDWISVPPKISSSQSSPSYPNVDTSFTRQYFVRVTINGCVSGYSEPLNIVVNPRPPKPFLLPIQPICLDDPNASLKLCILTGTPGAKYQFISADSGKVLGPPTSSLCFQTSNLSGLHPGLNTFYVITQLDSCSSLPSDPKTIQVDTIPNITAFAGDDIVICASQALMLNAADPGDGTWIQISGPPTTIVSPNDDNTLVNNVVADTMYQYKWTLSNGACKNYSTDTVKVTVVAPEPTIPDTTFKICETEVQLKATSGVNTSGMWSQPPIQEALGVTIDDPTDPNTWVRNLKHGQTFFFKWTLIDTGCNPQPMTTTVQVYSDKPFIGPDATICSAGCDSLDLYSTPLPIGEHGEFGIWSSQNQALVFGNPNNETTSVCNLQPGPNILYWTINGGFCGDQSRDTVIIDFDLVPIANADSIEVAFGEQVYIDVLKNDVLPANVLVSIAGNPAHGNLDTLGNGQYYYQPFAGYVGVDQMFYRVCNIACPGMACSVAGVKFKVGDVTGCPLPTLITPNGDGVNDALVFPCLINGDGLNLGELTVFNQWGNEVYHSAGYQNGWKGDYNGEDLPAGTYFYLLKADYLPKPVSRFLIIQR